MTADLIRQLSESVDSANIYAQLEHGEGLVNDLLKTAGADGRFADTQLAQQCAALPWRMGRDGKLQVLLVTSRRRGRWILPKGWLIDGLSPAQSAAREAFEEAGVVGRIAPDPIGSYIYEKISETGSSEPRNVTVFALHVEGTLLNWPEKNQRRRCWATIEEACEMVAKPGLVDFFRFLDFNSAATR